jgi:hypothetical protein
MFGCKHCPPPTSLCPHTRQALTFFPAILAVVGPEGDFGNVRKMFSGKKEP